MWTFTEHGFYSVVADRSQPTKMVWVRARTEEDIKHVTLITGHNYINMPSADYPWRIKMSHADWAAFLHSEASAIDYPNYKNRVATHDKDRAHLYSKVWQTMTELGCGWYDNVKLFERTDDFGYPGRDSAPSPEELLVEHRRFAEEVLDEFIDTYDQGASHEEGVIDLLTTLLHVVAESGGDIAQVLRFAEMHYLEEHLNRS